MARAGEQPSGLKFLRRRDEQLMFERTREEEIPWAVKLIPLDEIEEEPGEDEYEKAMTAVRRASFLTVVVDQGDHLDENGETVREWCAIEAGPNGGLIAAGPDKDTVAQEAEDYLAAHGGGQLVIATETPTRPLRTFIASSDWRDDPPPKFVIEIENSVPPRILVSLTGKKLSTPIGYFDAHEQKPLIRHLRSGKSLTVHPRLSQDRQGRVDGLSFDLWAEE